MRNDDDFIPRPVRRSDFTVIFAGLVHNLASSFHTFTEEILEISIYHANQKTKTMKAWEVAVAPMTMALGFIIRNWVSF